MKRSWIGIGILLGLLAVGLWGKQYARQQLERPINVLEQAAEHQNWDRAIALAQKAGKDWEKKQHWLAALVDHADLEQINRGFAQMEIYRQQKEKTDHAATCAQLAQAMRDLQESQKLTWWNLL